MLVLSRRRSFMSSCRAKSCQVCMLLVVVCVCVCVRVIQIIIQYLSSAVFCVAYASPPCNVLHTCGTQRVVHHWVPQKGGGTTGGWLLTSVAKLEPMARSCAYFLIWFAGRFIRVPQANLYALTVTQPTRPVLLDPTYHL